MELEEHLVSQNHQRAESPPCLGQPMAESSPSLEQVQNALNGSVRKRKAAELFGNIDDIGSDDEFTEMADLALGNSLGVQWKPEI